MVFKSLLKIQVGAKFANFWLILNPAILISYYHVTKS